MNIKKQTYEYGLAVSIFIFIILLCVAYSF